MIEFIRFIFIINLFFGTVWCSDSKYKFVGTHFIATYRDCNCDALNNVKELKTTLQEAINQSGASTLGYSEHTFYPKGYSIVWLLSESHA